MGIFGPSPTSAALPRDFSSAAPTLQPQPRRGLFGGMSARKIALIAAGMADAVDPLTMHPTGGGQLAGLMHANREDDETHHMDSVFRSAIDPVTGKLDPAKVIAGLGAHTPPAIWASLLPKDRAPQVVQGRNGSLATIDPDDPASYREIRPGDPETPAKPPIGTMWLDPNDPSQGVRPLPGYREAMGGLYDTRAAATAAHRAPPRGRSGGGGRAVNANPNTVKWD